MAEFKANGVVSQEAFAELQRTGEEMRVALNQPPADWQKGQLLNVRNYGPFYAVTLLHEEYSPEREERALKFTNPGELQDFVSRWYAPESYNPLAR